MGQTHRQSMRMISIQLAILRLVTYAGPSGTSVQPSHVATLVVPDRHDQDHATFKGLTHLG